MGHSPSRHRHASARRSVRLLALPLTLLALSTGVHAATVDETLEAETQGATGEAVSGAAERTAPPVESELVYSVNRTPEPAFDTARAVQVVTAAEIWRRNARSLPEVLMEEAGLFVQQTAYGHGAPIIRGLIGKQVLILVDGIRINNATFRFGPLQYLSTIDLAAVDRIEVVRGVGSVLGSDALGGTINIITKKGPFFDAEPGTKTHFFSRYSTADQAVTGRVELSGKSDKLRWTGGVTFRDASSLEGGGSIGEQAGTGYDEMGGNLNLDYLISHERTLSFTYLDLEQSGVPRTDRIASGRNLVFDYDPQHNQLASLSFQDLASRSWADSLSATVFWNRQKEGRQEIRSSAPTTERSLLDANSALGLKLEMSKFLGGSHRLLYGVDYSTEDIDSSRTDIDLVGGATRAKRGNYTDGASYDLLAVYLQDRFDVGEKLTVTVGGRYSSFSATGREDSSVGVLDLESSDQSLTGSVNLVFHASSRLNLIANATHGFRAPNIDDLSIFDERSNGTEVPNTDLESETIESFELGAKYASDSFSGSLFVYQSDLTDLLVRAAGQINGLSFFDLDGDGIQGADEPNVLQKQNIGEARVEGLELDFSYRPTDELTLFGNFATTTGDDLSANVPLRRIPPDFGTLGARWTRRGGVEPWAELIYHFAGDQTRLNPSDVSDSRIGPNGTDGFNVFHLRGGVSIGDRFAVTLALENITDEEYKYHASGVSRPAAQAVLGVRFQI